MAVRIIRSIRLSAYPPIRLSASFEVGRTEPQEDHARGLIHLGAQVGERRGAALLILGPHRRVLIQRVVADAGTRGAGGHDAVVSETTRETRVHDDADRLRGSG